MRRLPASINHNNLHLHLREPATILTAEVVAAAQTGKAGADVVALSTVRTAITAGRKTIEEDAMVAVTDIASDHQCGTVPCQLRAAAEL